VKVLGLGTAVPPGVVDQQEAAEFSKVLVAKDRRQARLLGMLFQRAGVDRRHSVLVSPDAEVAQDFYRPPRDDADGGPGTAARMALYEAEAGPLAVRASRAALEDAGLVAADIKHLVTVSCTGFHAPGPEVALIDDLGLTPEVGRVSVGFMGCHGAFNGLRVADSMVRAEPTAPVLVCAVELCSLHFSYQWDSEKLVANALFADGSAAFVCVADEAKGAGGSERLALNVGPFASCLLPDSRDAMSWRIGDYGFEMTLSGEVPALIERHLPSWLSGWLESQGVDHRCVDAWAVHPGGPRILDAVQRSMGLDEAALSISRAVLADHGNMSSATIGFILDRLRCQDQARSGVALGFGPGLMAEAFAFRLDGC